MGGKAAWQEKIARERIDILFEEARDAFPDHPERADRYVEIARTIAMKFTLSLPREYRERFCSDCYSYLKPGENARIRTGDGVKRITCEECGHTMRFPYQDEKKEKNG